MTGWFLRGLDLERKEGSKERDRWEEKQGNGPKVKKGG